MTDREALTSDELQAYREFGYVHLRGVFDAAEVAALSGAADELLQMQQLMDEDNLRVVLREIAGEMRVLQVNEIHQLSHVFDAARYHPRLVAAISAIWGEAAACFKAKIIYKPPGAKGAILHQDFAYWQVLPSSELVTAAVSIDEASADNGCMRMYPHWRRGLLQTDDILCVRGGQLENEGQLVETRPGDVILFHSLVPHESGENRSTSSRRQLFLSYNPAKLGDLSAAHQRHFMEYTKRHFIRDEARRARCYFR